ncbi:uncharacterized protein LOC132872854 [Neoarius graeffei]|uniref:uncharacterized protein LOC132872854 n=1 Tax=Neoarius graeffei TaxID=443677 RepID=UPI00298CB15E|nr:uncharacterized protein LOC132872854 [Neoarius graeffei]
MEQERWPTGYSSARPPQAKGGLEVKFMDQGAVAREPEPETDSAEQRTNMRLYTVKTECEYVKPYKVMEKQNDIIRSIKQLNDKVDALHAQTVPESVGSRTYQEREQDDEDTAETIIRRMASSKPEVRARTNYKQCLEVMGLPVKSLEEPKSANDKLDGEDKETKRRRNAVVNALTAYAPGMELGKNTVANIVRNCLYAIAPVYLWQCFSSQGKSGTTKGSLARDMPQIYRVIMAAAISITSMDSTTIISTIGAVIRSCPTRAESKKYRQDHPELFPDQQKSDENKTPKDKTTQKQKHNPTPKEKTAAIAINSVNGRKRPLSSDEDSEEDILTSSPECSTRQQPLRKTHVVPSAPGASAAGQNSSESESKR